MRTLSEQQKVDKKILKKNGDQKSGSKILTKIKVLNKLSDFFDHKPKENCPSHQNIFFHWYTDQWTILLEIHKMSWDLQNIQIQFFVYPYTVDVP